MARSKSKNRAGLIVTRLPAQPALESHCRRQARKTSISFGRTTIVQPMTQLYRGGGLLQHLPLSARPGTRRIIMQARV